MTASLKKEPLVVHLAELRKRLLYSLLAVFVAFVVCYMFAQDIFSFLVKPYAEAVGNDPSRKLISTGLAETFFAYMRVSFYFAIFFALPIIIDQFRKFIEPGLYKHEKKVMWPFLVAGPALFIVGAGLAYYFVMPLAWKFFLDFEATNIAGTVSVELLPRVSQYLSMALKMLFAFGICFQLPIFIMIAANLGLATASGLRKKRKYAIVIVLIVAAVLTPPDIISQLLLAIPVMLLYEVSIFLAASVEKKRKK